MKYWVFRIETYLIEFLDPKNVHFDTNIIIIALTEAKIWGLVWCNSGLLLADIFKMAIKKN